jgi:hypothetical protein
MLTHAVKHHIKCGQRLFQIHSVPFSVTLAAQFTNMLLQKPVEVKKQIK